MIPSQSRSFGSTTLLAGLVRRDPSAREEFCRRYGSRVERMVRRRLGPLLRSRFETADLAQEAMVDMLEAAAGCEFQGEAAFLGWAQKIVEHRILQMARHCRAARRSPLREVPLEGEALAHEGKGETPSQALERQEAIERLSCAVAALPPPDRQVVVTRLFLKLPWSRVAALAGVNEPTAQMRWVRARRRLEAALRAR
jgi:RNA polymerase sigma-70 factor, ECF subfamily